MSHKDENDELNDILNKPAHTPVMSGHAMKARRGNYPSEGMAEDSHAPRELKALVQWTTSDEKVFVPASKTAKALSPGLYEIAHSPTIGLYFQKTPVKTEGLLRFPQTNSDRVVREIQKFWELEAGFREYGLSYKRGLILWGPPGCHAAGTGILMYDGSVKKVEDVEEGDRLMGPDSKPREVLVLRRGADEMYRITPRSGESFIVNAHHYLYLEWSGKEGNGRGDEIMVKDYIGLSDWKKSRYKLVRRGVDYTEKDLSLEPYFLGLWLGDGVSTWSAVTTADYEVVSYLNEFAEREGVVVRQDVIRDNASSNYYFVGRNRNRWADDNHVLKKLRQANILGNKHVPQEYLTASRQQRLELLAGIIDSDGHYSNGRINEIRGQAGTYEVIQKSPVLASDIQRLARSLGFRASLRTVTKKIKSRGFGGVYNIVSIGGNLSEIPVRIERKKCLRSSPNKDCRRTGIVSVKSLGRSDAYYGFTVSDDNLYLTADYMVHRNSGKTCTIQLIMADVIERQGVVLKFCNPGMFMEGMRILREIQPKTPVVVLMEDIDATIEDHSQSEVLQILDGVDRIDRVAFLACPAPETLILKSDLRWVRADSLKDGDELIAFDEQGPGRKYRTAQVNSCPIVNRPRYKVVTEMGSIVVSESHPFLVKLGNRPHEWRMVEELRPGNKIATIGKPWKTDPSHSGGYLAGQFDGEGCLNFCHSSTGGVGFRATWTQAVGEVSEHVERLLLDRGFALSKDIRKPNKSGRYGPYKTKVVLSPKGGRWEHLRLLGTIRPMRLLAHHRLKDAWDGVGLQSQYTKVMSVEPVDFGPVVALDTTTGTFIGEGMLQHNTTNYPERLGARILNRPSRFDKRFKIGHPNPESRKLYFKHLITEKIKDLKLNIDQWVEDTDRFSLAHLKELFVAVVILGDDYKEAVKTLGSMKEPLHSDDERDRAMGFNPLKQGCYDEDC